MLTDCFAALDRYLAEKRDQLPCGMLEAVAVRFYGDGIDAYEKQLADFSEEMTAKYGTVKVILAERQIRYQTAEMTAVCALERYLAGQMVTVEAVSYTHLLWILKRRRGTCESYFFIKTKQQTDGLVRERW